MKTLSIASIASMVTTVCLSACLAQVQSETQQSLCNPDEDSTCDSPVGGWARLRRLLSVYVDEVISSTPDAVVDMTSAHCGSAGGYSVCEVYLDFGSYTIRVECTSDPEGSQSCTSTSY